MNGDNVLRYAANHRNLKIAQVMASQYSIAVDFIQYVRHVSMKTILKILSAKENFLIHYTAG